MTNVQKYSAIKSQNYIHTIFSLNLSISKIKNKNSIHNIKKIISYSTYQILNNNYIIFSQIMIKPFILGFLAVSATTFSIQAPHTNIGNETVACHPASAPAKTNEFSTYFSDDVYACSKWNHKAKSSTECFVALNGVCGMNNSEYCDKCVLITNSKGASQKCRVIDFCDPKNCDFLDPGHLDILNNNANSHYKFTDQGKYVVLYQGAGGQPFITWAWTSC